MATFIIHEDENAGRKPGNCKSVSENLHNDGKNTKRHVLGDIQNNISRPFAQLKRNASSEPFSSVPSGFIENIKALGLKDKPAHCLPEKLSPKSSLNDLRITVGNENALGYRKENVIGESCDKENIFNASIDSISAEKEKVGFLEDEVTNTSFPDTSRNEEGFLSEENELKDPVNDEASCGSPQVSRQEVSKSILDDIYYKSYYKEDVFKYLLTVEKKFQPSAYYMRRQPQITHSMRTILVDWLVEVGEEYNLSNETLFIAVALTDRFLSFMAITKAKLQLLGTAAMMAAAKFEEIYPPETGAFVYITDDSYTVNQLIRMERLLLKVLNFDISSPTIYSFLTLIFSCEKVITKIFYLAIYLSELTLLQADPYLQFYPSLIASSTVVMARHCLDCKDIWPASHVKLTGYSLTQLVPVINHLNETHQMSFTSSQQAIRNKYSSAKYRCVSMIPYRKLTLRES